MLQCALCCISNCWLVYRTLTTGATEWQRETLLARRFFFVLKNSLWFNGSSICITIFLLFSSFIIHFYVVIPHFVSTLHAMLCLCLFCCLIITVCVCSAHASGVSESESEWVCAFLKVHITGTKFMSTGFRWIYSRVSCLSLSLLRMRFSARWTQWNTPNDRTVYLSRCVVWFSSSKDECV